MTGYLIRLLLVTDSSRTMLSTSSAVWVRPLTSAIG